MSSAPVGVAEAPSRREQILVTAAQLFASRGFHGVSVSELGAACGITGPALYKHFASKDAVLAEMLVSISEQLLSVGRARVRAAGVPAAALAALVGLARRLRGRATALIVVQDRDWQSLPPQASRTGPPAAAQVRRPLGRAAARDRPRAGADRGPRDGPRGVRPDQLHPPQWPAARPCDARAAAGDGAALDRVGARRSEQVIDGAVGFVDQLQDPGRPQRRVDRGLQRGVDALGRAARPTRLPRRARAARPGSGRAARRAAAGARTGRPRSAR